MRYEKKRHVFDNEWREQVASALNRLRSKRGIKMFENIFKNPVELSSTLLVDAGELYDLIHMHGFAKAQMIASGNQEALEKALHWIIKETTFDNRQYGESWKEYALREAGLSMIEMYP